MKRVAAYGLCMWGLAVLAVPASAATPHVAGIDTAQSQIRFYLKTRWGQTLQGRFPVYEGEVVTLDDGRKHVRLTMSASHLEIVGQPRYTRIARGGAFFDAARHPQISFASDPYDEAIVRGGGVLTGELGIRDITRRETFTLWPAGCADPGRECPIIASGIVLSSDYGLDRWSFALAQEVRFSLHIRTRDDDGDPP